MSATSSGRPIRFISTVAAARASSSWAPYISTAPRRVAIRPGTTTFAVTPYCAVSNAMPRVMPTTALLLACTWVR